MEKGKTEVHFGLMVSVILLTFAGKFNALN